MSDVSVANENTATNPATGIHPVGIMAHEEGLALHRCMCKISDELLGEMYKKYIDTKKRTPNLRWSECVNVMEDVWGVPHYSALHRKLVVHNPLIEQELRVVFYLMIKLRHAQTLKDQAKCERVRVRVQRLTVPDFLQRFFISLSRSRYVRQLEYFKDTQCRNAAIEETLRHALYTACSDLVRVAGENEQELEHQHDTIQDKNTLLRNDSPNANSPASTMSSKGDQHIGESHVENTNSDTLSTSNLESSSTADERMSNHAQKRTQGGLLPDDLQSGSTNQQNSKTREGSAKQARHERSQHKLHSSNYSTMQVASPALSVNNGIQWKAPIRSNDIMHDTAYSGNIHTRNPHYQSSSRAEGRIVQNDRYVVDDSQTECSESPRSDMYSSQQFIQHPARTMDYDMCASSSNRMDTPVSVPYSLRSEYSVIPQDKSAMQEGPLTRASDTVNNKTEADDETRMQQYVVRKLDQTPGSGRH